MSHSHSFSKEYAEEYGVDCAVLINHFLFWILQNAKMGRNFHDGHTWMYQTQQEIAAVHSYWSRDTIQRIIKKLVENEILITGNYNKSSYDRTVWYAFKNEEMFSITRNRTMENATSHNRFCDTAPPIPVTKTDNNNCSVSVSPSAPEEKNLIIEERISSSLEVVVTNGIGKTLTMSESEIYSHFIKQPFPTEVVREAISRIRGMKVVNDILRCLVGTCKKIMLERQKNDKNSIKKTKNYLNPYDTTENEIKKPPKITHINAYGELVDASGVNLPPNIFEKEMALSFIKNREKKGYTIPTYDQAIVFLREHRREKNKLKRIANV